MLQERKTKQIYNHLKMSYFVLAASQRHSDIRNMHVFQPNKQQVILLFIADFVISSSTRRKDEVYEKSVRKHMTSQE